MAHTRTNNATWIEKDQRWKIAVQKDGKRRQFYSSTPGKRGQRECNAKADAWLQSAASVDSDARVAEVMEKWLGELKATTSYDHWRQYRGFADRDILPKIGFKRVSELDEQILQEIINSAYSGRNLAYKTLKNMRGCINSFLKYCRKNSLTSLFPESITLPRQAVKGEKQILNPGDLRVLFASDLTTYRGKIVHDFYIHAYRAQAITGLRPGELIALQTTDDLGFALAAKGSINIHGEHTTGKNDNARRSVSESALLRQVLADQAAMLKAHGVRSKYIFPAPTGKPIDEQTYCRYLKRYCEYNRITIVRPYELRHTFVSAAKNLPEGIMKSMVGHSKSMDTYGVYSHALAEDDATRADLLDEVWTKLKVCPKVCPDGNGDD